MHAFRRWIWCGFRGPIGLERKAQWQLAKALCFFNAFLQGLVIAIATATSTEHLSAKTFERLLACSTATHLVESQPFG